MWSNHRAPLLLAALLALVLMPVRVGGRASYTFQHCSTQLVRPMPDHE
jgi:hypothetical protein